MNRPLIVGINSGIDASLAPVDSGGACLLSDRRIVGAIAEERISRKKYQGGYEAALNALLAEHRFQLSDIDAVALSFYRAPAHPPDALVRYHESRLNLPATTRLLCLPSHHLSHAYSAYFLSPFEHALIVVADNEGSDLYPCGGEWLERNSYYLAAGNSVHLLHRDFENPGDMGFGKAYNRFTRYLGLGDYHAAGKTMGLSSYADVPEKMLGIDVWQMGGDGRLVSTIRDNASLENGDDQAQLEDLRRFFQHHGVAVPPPARQGQWEDPIYQELAAFIQHQLNKWMLRKVKWLVERTGCRNVCFGGGVALNAVTNSYVEREGNLRAFASPYGSDEGQAVGNAIHARVTYDQRALARGAERLSFTDYVFCGTCYATPEILERIRPFSDEWVMSPVDDVASIVARTISQGAVVGWFQGRSEFGARALGARSIVADPRDGGLRSSLNRSKGREKFRPFAPSVLEEAVREYFLTEDSLLFDHMLGVAAVRPEKAAQIPAVVHVDTTARLQIVRRHDTPLYHDLITEFRRLTGVGLILNTSFNFAGEPIVETPEDALRSAAVLGLDAVALGDVLCVRRTSQHAGQT